MKRILPLLLILLMFTGCTKNTNNAQQAGTGHSNVTFKDITPDSEKNDASSNYEDDGNLADPDINISAGDTNLIYSKATEISSNYQSYLGKTIRIKGNYKVEKSTSRNYYYCLVSDPTACCNAGFEFILKNDSAYPKNDGEQFIVQGKLHSYQEGTNTYLELIDASIIK